MRHAIFHDEKMPVVPRTHVFLRTKTAFHIMKYWQPRTTLGLLRRSGDAGAPSRWSTNSLTIVAMRRGWASGSQWWASTCRRQKIRHPFAEVLGECGTHVAVQNVGTMTFTGAWARRSRGARSRARKIGAIEPRRPWMPSAVCVGLGGANSPSVWRNQCPARPSQRRRCHSGSRNYGRRRCTTGASACRGAPLLCAAPMRSALAAWSRHGPEHG